jgi:hypothetical protein
MLVAASGGAVKPLIISTPDVWAVAVHHMFTKRLCSSSPGVGTPTAISRHEQSSFLSADS